MNRSSLASALPPDITRTSRCRWALLLAFLSVSTAAIGLFPCASEAQDEPAGDKPRSADGKRVESPAKDAKDDAAPPSQPRRPGFRIESLNGVSEVESGDDVTLSLEGEGDGATLVVGVKQVAIRDVLFLHLPRRSYAATRPGVALRLRDGDVILGRVLDRSDAVGEDDILLSSPLFAGEDASHSVPIDSVKIFAFANAFRNTAALRQAEERVWNKTRGADSEVDILHLTSGDPIEGFLDDVGGKSLKFATEKLGDLELAHEKVKMVVLAAEEDDAKAGSGKSASPGTIVRLYLRDGGHVSGRLLSLSTRVARIEHADLGELDVRIDHVAQVGFLGGRCQFLSDLSPVAAREHLGPLFRTRLPHRRDTNVRGGPLRVAGRLFPKGLGVHAYSRLEYDLDGNYDRFQATIGLDESARPRVGVGGRAGAAGSVVFRVFLENKVLLQQAMDHADEPREVDLPVAGGKRLVLEVDFGEGDVQLALDRANWCSARLIKN